MKPEKQSFIKKRRYFVVYYMVLSFHSERGSYGAH
ncbi:hypothetical protein ENINMM205M_01510 [Enterobacter intestinihominis]|nr:hypothetical protein [Enterobacter sp. SLBN-59]WHS97818.1 MAG: hypothetical protein LZT29_00699 [Pantoea stewartii]